MRPLPRTLVPLWMDLTHAPFDLDRLIEELADLFANRVAGKDLELVFAITPQVPRQLVGDAARLTQVLINLIENAVKFTAEGEIVVNVEATDQHNRRTHLTFRVSDTGAGIDPDLLPNLFEPFTQGGSYLTRQHEGNGLGLAICRRLVEPMGGKIQAESMPGRGSTFSFTVPLMIQQERKPVLILPEAFDGLKTLMVENSVMARQALLNLLESYKCNSVAVDSSDKAIAALDQVQADEPFQLVLLDWKLGGRDGLETCAAIRNRQNPPPIILMVTAYGRELVQEHMETPAKDTLLVKPVTSSRLFETIMEVLGQTEDMPRHHAHQPVSRLP